jgi:hypothetical protein
MQMTQQKEEHEDMAEGHYKYAPSTAYAKPKGFLTAIPSKNGNLEEF